MVYRHQSSWLRQYNGSYSSVTTVSVHWSSKSSAYMVNFSDTKHWNEMQVLINFIKGLDVSEKDCQCDESSGKKVWTWYFVEKYLEPFKALVESFGGQAGGIFEIDIITKPTGGSNQSIFVPVDVYLERFKSLTSFDIIDMEYSKAKMIYRKFCKVFHPDLNPGDDTSKLMSELNQTWSALELQFFKSKKEQEYVNA